VRSPLIPSLGPRVPPLALHPLNPPGTGRKILAAAIRRLSPCPCSHHVTDERL
jgi:hypothetical protein